MKRFLLMIPMVLLLLTACGSKQAPSAEIPGDGALEIPVSELSEKIQIYSFTVDGLNMEVLAAKDADGTVRTAFNTCQVCNGSRKAYFQEEGDHVVCQNCGNSFSKEDVGVLSGGCNPYPIFPEDRADTEDTVTISYDFLKSAEGLFTRWKENSPAGLQ